MVDTTVDRAWDQGTNKGAEGRNFYTFFLTFITKALIVGFWLVFFS
jgi:hypothetical protein